MNVVERKALVAKLCRKLDERPDLPVMQWLFSILRNRPNDKVHQCLLTDEDLYCALHWAPSETDKEPA